MLDPEDKPFKYSRASVLEARAQFDAMDVKSRAKLERCIIKLGSNIKLVKMLDMVSVFNIWRLHAMLESRLAQMNPVTGGLLGIEAKHEDMPALDDSESGSYWRNVSFQQDRTISHLRKALDEVEIKLNVQRRFTAKLILPQLFARPLLDAWTHWKKFVKQKREEWEESVMRLRDDVERQKRNAEMEAFKQAQATASRLSSQIMCIMFFFKWKHKKVLDDVREKERVWMEEKKVIRKELIAMRLAMAKFHNDESDVMYSALNRGASVTDSLRKIYEQLEQLKKRSVQT